MLETLLNSPVVIYDADIVKYVQINIAMLLCVIYFSVPFCISQFYWREVYSN